MNVYIKGIEVPKSCWSCYMPLGALKCPVQTEEEAMRYCSCRHKDCPLVPVPPHGRLIDADAFCEKILEIVERQKYDDFYAKSFSVGAILREVVNELKGMGLDGFGNAPTIIPASTADKEGEG